MKMQLLLITLLAASSCTKTEEPAPITTTTSENNHLVLPSYRILENKELDYKPIANDPEGRISLRTLEGDRLNFMFTQKTDYLDGFNLLVEVIGFELDKNSTSFSFTNPEQLAQAKAHYAAAAYGTTPSYIIPAALGSISGKKISEKEWEVTMTITVQTKAGAKEPSKTFTLNKKTFRID